MRWLVTGAGGQLGHDLRLLLAADPAATVRATGHADLDITDPGAVADVLADFGPDVVVNAAAYTNVDRAESDEDAARAANATGPAVLAAASARSGARLVHLSTDYVFPGDATRPYEVDDPTGPRSAYGRTKLAGEQAVRELHPDGAYVVRTAWVYGLVGRNFVRTMVRLADDGVDPAVVDDQRGSPTWSAHLARGLVDLVRSGAAPGTYHATGGGDTTWFELAREVFRLAGADPERVRPTTSDQYPSPVRRPAYSVLSSRSWEQAGLPPLPLWREALHEAFAAEPAAFRS